MATTIVKTWIGSSNNPKDPEYKEFKTKKEALAYIKEDKKFRSMSGAKPMLGFTKFYEVYKKEK